MRIGVTGTPGTGKTTATGQVSLDRPIVHVNEVIESEGLTSGWDDSRETAIADIEALEGWLADQPGSLLIESHLAHLLSVDHAIVLRCDPEELEARLRARLDVAASGGLAKVDENVESERIDVIYVEALHHHGEKGVTAIDTTEQTPAETARAIERAAERIERRDRPAGEPGER